MGNEIRADYDQMYLLPATLEEWVGRDHPARFIREFVDSLDLEGLGFEIRSSEEGRPNYAAELLLKVWLYGYFQKIRSSRALERACFENMGLIWLAGRHTPDHNTLWRFFQKHRRAIKQLFKASVQVAVREDLIGMVLHAVDGTKIQASCSGRSARHRQDLERALRQLDESVEDVLQQTEAAEQRDSGPEGGYRLPPELADKEQLRERIQKALKELDQAGLDHQSPTDPQARMMKCEGRIKFGYNAQAVVDGQSRMIVAQEVVQEAADNAQLVPMLEQVEAQLGSTAEETLADGGYESSQQLAQAEQRGYGVLVKLSPTTVGETDGSEFHSSKFSYDRELDCCVCPLGETLTFERVRQNPKKSYAVRLYRCGAFRSCPRRAVCSRDPRGRSIEIGPHHEALARQREKFSQPDKRELLRQRMVISEQPFAHIKHAMGFRRWTVWGLEGVQAQWALVCTTYNLRKLFKRWQAARLALQPA